MERAPISFANFRDRTLAGMWVLTIAKSPSMAPRDGKPSVSSFRHVTIFRHDHSTPGVQPDRNVVASELKLPQVLLLYRGEGNFFTSLAQSLLFVFSS